MTAIPLPRRFRYHVLLSYSSEDGEYVHAVREALLHQEVKVCDYAEGVNLGLPLLKTIERRYTYDAPFCAVFISKAYLKKDWTNKELAIVRRVAKRKPGYMLPVVIDGAKIPELEDIVFLENTTLSAKEVGARIAARIREPPPPPRWFFSTEVKVAIAVALVVLILAAYLAYILFWPSRTSLKSVQADANAIIAHVINSGPRSATLVGQRLQFGALPIKHAELRLENPAAGTIAPGEHDVRLIAQDRELLPECDADGNRPGNHEIVPLLSTHEVKLEVNVQESDDAPGHSSKQAKPIPAAGLKLFVGKWVPSRVPPCKSPGLRSSRRLRSAGTYYLKGRRANCG